MKKKKRGKYSMFNAVTGLKVANGYPYLKSQFFQNYWFLRKLKLRGEKKNTDTFTTYNPDPGNDALKDSSELMKDQGNMVVTPFPLFRACLQNQ